MNRKELRIKSDDGVYITVYKWGEEKEQVVLPKGIVLILHGMAEHALRYEEFANYLVNNGYLVYACDHRGHGKTGSKVNKLGFFADENGWQRVVDDIHIIVKKIKQDYSDIPLILFGHSMGSLLARTCIYQFGLEFNGVIISGTTIGTNAFKRKMGSIMAKIFIKKYGQDKEAKLLDDLSFGSYNKSFKPNKTKFDWLSRDEKKVKEYVDDELCGFICTGAFFNDLLTGIQLTINKNNINQIPKRLPIFIISGENDPVGGKTKEVKKVYNAYKNAGIKDVTLKFYKDGRHEILNEINKEEVYKDILDWINKVGNQ